MKNYICWLSRYSDKPYLAGIAYDICLHVQETVAIFIIFVCFCHQGRADLTEWLGTIPTFTLPESRVYVRLL